MLVSLISSELYVQIETNFHKIQHIVEENYLPYRFHSIGQYFHAQTDSTAQSPVKQS